MPAAAHPFQSEAPIGGAVMDDFGPAEDVIGDVMGSLRAIEQEHIDKGPKRKCTMSGLPRLNA